MSRPRSCSAHAFAVGEHTHTVASGVAALPACAQICSRNNVPKGDLTEAIARGCADVPELTKCTKRGPHAGRVCRCSSTRVPLLEQLLEAEGVGQSTTLCEHFSQSNAEL